MLDDLQWADTSTALLLGHMLQDVEADAAARLGTIREAGGHRAEELTALLAPARRDPGFERIALDGLDDAETQALVAAHDARDAAARSSCACSEGTEGNPFFIKETLRSLADWPTTSSSATLAASPCPRASRS